MSKAGLPLGIKMRHDAHYVEQIAAKSRSVGRTIPITSIFPNPEQPRTEFGDLTELTESIKEIGVLEPLLVHPTKDGRFMIIAGERRWRASQLAGLTEVPCIEMAVDEKGIAEIALIENLQRKDLTVWEEADGLASLKGRFGYTQDEIAHKISKGRTTVTELLTIATLPDIIRERCRAGNISSKAILLEIARQFDDQAMLDYLDNLNRGSKRAPGRTSGAKEGIQSQPPATEDSLEAKPVFRFVPDDHRFTLEIKFGNDGSHTKRDVLEALKGAFDSVKDSQG